jgi:polyisoprenoid-binding protein YceI
MKRILLASAAAAILMSAPLAASTPAWAAESYKFDPMHTNVVFHANHLGFSNPSGRFGIKDGKIVLDETDPAKSSVDVVIDASSVATGMDVFNQHIKEKFLQPEKFPTAEFKSTKVEKTGEKTAKVTGDLTLHGVTKPVTLDVTLNKEGDHPMMHKKAVGFTASTTIKRSDFGMDLMVGPISDDVKIDIEAEAEVM